MTRRGRQKEENRDSRRSSSPSRRDLSQKPKGFVQLLKTVLGRSSEPPSSSPSSAGAARGQEEMGGAPQARVRGAATASTRTPSPSPSFASDEMGRTLLHLITAKKLSEAEESEGQKGASHVPGTARAAASLSFTRRRSLLKVQTESYKMGKLQSRSSIEEGAEEGTRTGKRVMETDSETWAEVFQERRQGSPDEVSDSE